MAVDGAALEMSYEWVKEVREFDESKIGIKGLVDSGITTIPSIFIHPPEYLSDLKPSSKHFEIPVIDLSTKRRSEVVSQIKESLSSWGFFQVINHGVPIQVVESTLNAFKSFHEEPNEVKKEKYVWNDKVAYYNNFNVLSSKAVNWKDSLRVFTSPNPPELEAIPSVCRKEVIEWDAHMNSLCETLMELICEGLCVDLNRLKELSCHEMRKVLCHYYPFCPQPDLTLGLPSHTDRGILTLLLQNEVGGLQVKYRDEWVEVKPIPGAVIVNAGDLLQILSNDKIQSVEHRVLANPRKEPRISVAVIFNPGKKGESDYYGPLPELLSPENPAIYRSFTIPEMLKHGQTDDCVRAIIDLFKGCAKENAK